MACGAEEMLDSTDKASPVQTPQVQSAVNAEMLRDADTMSHKRSLPRQAHLKGKEKHGCSENPALGPRKAIRTGICKTVG